MKTSQSEPTESANGLDQLLKPRPVRRLLAIDGGGVRGAIPIGVLSRIEQVLRDRTGRPGLVLADYFDFIGGTSIGAVIAAALSTGLSLDEVRSFATENLSRFFQPASIWKRFRHKYSAEGLNQCLIENFGEVELGSSKLKTLVMIVLRNASTDSPWIVTNNPLAKYNDASRLDCNLRLPLWQLLRGSAAAPTFFPCERIRLDANDFQFVDGAGTIANNPAFQLFLQATLPAYGLKWPTGPDKMLLISVGTGGVPTPNTADAHFFANALAQIKCLSAGATIEQDLLCRLLGRCLCGDPIDRELGDLIRAEFAWPAQFTYCRYNAELSAAMLGALGHRRSPARFHTLDNTSAFAELLALGESIGSARVRPEHFDGFV
ncbi:MAG TPA: patatin-like phospholipase family protein [Pirellulaceae bacterium]|nr:patatin-like phospholipase family protein [Pirellulaceae bacterium]HMO91977.1 patatin-like phospholipase family protein [Pirellulaceae bacterium]HMP68776.1 patatin-like phospholipase family protein [Pirellulaceae bacterium]